jgi:putative ABC transport system permease protein
MLLQLAARNLLRHRARAGTALAAIAAGVMSMILAGGLVQDMYTTLGEALIYSQSGHLQAGHPAIFSHGSRAPEKFLIAAPERVKARLSEMEGVTHVMARLSFSGLLNNGKVDLPIIGDGVEPELEANLARSISMLSGRLLSGRDRNGILVGEGLARALQLEVGDPVTVVASTLDGAVNTGDFEVVGVFRSFSKEYDERAVRLPLAAAQDLVGTIGANLIVLLLDRTERTSAAAAAAGTALAGSGLAVKRWEEVNDFYANTVALYDRQLAVLRVIMLFMVLLGVANAVNMSVFERMSEFGTMRALGNRSGFVVALILTECLLLGVAGALVGAVAGSLLAVVISAIGIPMPPPPNSNAGYTAQIPLLPAIVAQSFAIGVTSTLLSGLLPALKARRVGIVDALRTSF